MKRIKTLLLVWLSLLFLVSCGNNKLSFDQKMLSGLFQEKDGSFLPGDVKWDDSKEEVMILSRLVDTFFSRISLTMQPPPKPHNTACVLPWEEGRHWQSRSSDCSSS